MADSARASSVPTAPRFIAPRPHPLRRWLWKTVIAGIALVAVLIASDAVGRWRNPTHKLALGHDLLPSYAAGVMVRRGTPRLMYDRQAMTALEFHIIREADLDIDGRYGPWLNPPFYAWVFAPLAVLPYRQAAAVFLGINLALITLSLFLLTRMVIARLPGLTEPALSPRADWRTCMLVPLICAVPLPLWQAMGHQQNTFISFLLLILAVTFWRQKKAFIAGAAAGLLFFKPQLAAILAAVLVLDLGWRALAGILMTGAILLFITLLTMPGCLGDFLHRLPPILHWLQIESPYNWGRQVTFQSFWRLLIQGHVRAETALIAKVLWGISSGMFVVGFGSIVWRYRAGRRDGTSRDRLIAAAIVSMPVLMPYYMDYDLLLLAVPAVLLAAEWVRTPADMTRTDYWLLAAWGTFCIESHLNPGLAGHSRLNLAVPLLATLAVLHIRRCLRPAGNTAFITPSQAAPLANAA